MSERTASDAALVILADVAGNGHGAGCDCHSSAQKRLPPPCAAAVAVLPQRVRVCVYGPRVRCVVVPCSRAADGVFSPVPIMT